MRYCFQCVWTETESYLAMVGLAARRLADYANLQSVLRTVFSCLIVFSITISLAYSQGNPEKIAESGLTEFDIASYCYGAEYSNASGPGDQPDPTSKHSESRFGYISPSDEQKNAVKQQFVYIASRYYVQIGPYGDPGDCEFKRYAYRLTPDDLFTREELDEKKFARVKTDLEAARRAFAQSNPGKIFGLPDPGPSDSIGNCLFPIYWYRLHGEDYAIFSTVRQSVGIIGYVIPHYQRALSGKPSNCLAWGERHLTNSSIISNKVKYLPIDDGHFFIETAENKGFIFKTGTEFECFKGRDIFEFHILAKKRFFDAEIRPSLERTLLKQKQTTNSEGKDAVLSFIQSVSLSQEFATLVAGFAKDKGCK